MLRVGDWITVPSTNANGIVMDVTLTVVKVQNFDNTMVMLPPYTLVSTSFQNWRNMFEVGFRMIDHNIFIDRSTWSSPLRSRLLPCARNFLCSTSLSPTRRQPARRPPRVRKSTLRSTATLHGINGTIDTNLGLFRAYACSYLIHHPKVNSQTQDMLISMDPPESYGIALNVNCYSTMAQLGPVRSSEGRDNRTSHRRSRRIRTADLQRSRPEHLLPAEGRSRARLHGTQSRSHLTAAMNPPDASRRPDCRLFSFFS